MYDKLKLITEDILIANNILSMRIFAEPPSHETEAINELLGEGVEKCKSEDLLDPLLSVLKDDGTGLMNISYKGEKSICEFLDKLLNKS